MELSVPLRSDVDATRLPEVVRGIEGAGADLLWVTEAYGRDAVSVLGLCSAVTGRIRLGAGVLGVFGRSPALLAQTAASLDELSGGRFELGLGASGPQMVEGWHGIAFDRPVTRTRDVVAICRRVWRRERLTHDGAAVRIPLDGGRGLKLSAHPPRAQIPVWLAAIGPRSVRTAAEIADGWLPPFFVPERAGTVWGADLAAGLARRDPASGVLRIGAGGPVELTGPGSAAAREARSRARPWLARYVGGMGTATTNFYHDLLCRYGFADDAARVRRLYLAGDGDAAAAALSEEVLEAVTVCGPPSYVRERLAAYRAAGVTTFRMVGSGPGGPDPRTVERVAELLR